MEPPQLDLKQYGIDVGLLMSGLFGAILLTSKESAMNLTRTISSLVGGAASANYITPIVVNIANLNGDQYRYSLSFLLGFLGLKGIEHFSKKIIPDNLHEELIPKTRPKTTSKRTRKSK